MNSHFGHPFPFLFAYLNSSILLLISQTFFKNLSSSSLHFYLLKPKSQTMARLSYPVNLGMRFDMHPNANPERVELHPEMYIDFGYLNERLPNWVGNTLAFQGWLNFASRKLSGHTSLCAEFLYFARRADKDSILIRGVEISFTPEAIREACTLPWVETCFYNLLVRRRSDTNFERVVLSTLSLPTLQPQIDNFPSTSLNKQAAFWFFFVKTRILPLTLESNISWDAMVLIYCLMERKPIDAVPLIYQSLKSQIFRNDFRFPCLISKISKAAGLRHAFHEDEKFSGFKLDFCALRIIDNILEEAHGWGPEEDDEE